MIFAIATFFLSLAGIAGLLAVKEWEWKRGKILFPAVREKLDLWDARLRELVCALQVDIEKLPPEIIHISRIIVHEAALAAAAFLRSLEKRAHQLADLVSHKHAFQRRAPRSEFLKKVSEHKNSSGNGNDGTPHV